MPKESRSYRKTSSRRSVSPEPRRRHSERDKPKDSADRRDASSTVKPIGPEDFYARNSEFRLWLLRKKSVYFDELDSKEARSYFKKFVTKWNAGELSGKYYSGIKSSDLDSRAKTRYEWGFTKNMDTDKLDDLRESVAKDTAEMVLPNKDRTTRWSQRPQIGPNPQGRSSQGPSRPPGDDRDRLMKQEDSWRARNDNLRRERRDFRTTHETALEEMMPKETGREAMMEKRRLQTAYHRSERDTQSELNDNELHGSGDSFQARIQSQQSRRGDREQQREKKIEAKTADIQDMVDSHKAKEQATIDRF
ncbi:hypothetical protein H4R33_001914, partial [Dimargaris cristalligena]